MNATFADDIESGRRILSMAAPDKRPKAFALIARESVRWHTIKGMPKPDVVDALRTIGLEAGLADADLQTALGQAFDNPFEPASAAPPTGTRHSDSVTSADDQLVIRRASEIEPQAIRWLWPNRIALGKVTIVAGEPGLGKSQLTCAIAAAVTKGAEWPCGEGRAPTGSVIIFSAEDDAADTIRPRLDAAGADVTKVQIVSAVRKVKARGRRSFSLQDDLPLLEAAIREAGDVLLVVIDPVSSYLGKVDSHKNAELRAVLEPLGEMAARLGVAVLAITHLSKSGNGSAINRFIGSIAFVAAARAAFIVARDKDDKDRRLFLPTKNNVGPEGTGLAFRVHLMDISPEIRAPMILWEGPVAITAEEALAGDTARKEAAPERKAAEDFLSTILANGPLPMRRIQSEAKEAGLTMTTVRRAKGILGVIARKTALDGGWIWELPPDHPE